MSNYRNHAIFSIIFSIAFVPSLFYLFFALIGSSIPDLDHDNNRNKVNRMIVFGMILSVLLFFINASNISALLLIMVPFIFYFSKHRGFTHTLIGIISLSFLFLLIIMGFLPLFNNINKLFYFNINEYYYLLIALIIVGLFVINKKYYLSYVVLLIVYWFGFSATYIDIDWIFALSMLICGAFSHIILDLFTPAGLAFLKPFSNMKYHKKMGYILVLIWLLLVIYSINVNGFLFNHFNPIFTYT